MCVCVCVCAHVCVCEMGGRIWSVTGDCAPGERMTCVYATGSPTFRARSVTLTGVNSSFNATRDTEPRGRRDDVTRITDQMDRMEMMS